MRTASTKGMAVVVERPQRHENPNYPVRNDFESEDIKPAVAELKAECDEFRRRSSEWYYALGKIVRQHYQRVEAERAEMGRSMYGARFFKRLAQELNEPKVDGQLLSDCFNLVETYDEEAYKELCQHDAISPTHALMLGCVHIGELRAELEQMVVNENLTTGELEMAKREKLGIHHRPGAGRPPKRPKKLKDAFTHLTNQVAKFVNLNDQVWFGDSYDIIAEIKGLTAGRINDELKKQVSEAAQECDRLAAVAQRDAEALRDILPEIDRRMKAQAKIDARLQEELKAEEQDEAEIRAERQARRANAPTHRPRAASREIGRAARAVRGLESAGVG